MPRKRYAHLPVTIFLIGLFGFLCVRSAQPNRWSGWDFGDAQTMMAATVFRDEGFLATSFLWVPQPSSPIAKYMDDPAVNHHAHGTGGDQQFSGLGPKRMYTHWPSWYSIPYGIFAKMGVLDKTVFQIWASLLSILALVFFYLFLRKITDDWVATVAVFIYGMAPSFQMFADSLATMPYDDFFRFAFLWAWAEREQDDSAVKKWILPGALYLGGFLTSLDSFAFMPVAAFVSDWLQKKGEYKKTILTIGAFGVAALLVQLAQNISYLGLLGAWKDWNGYFGANSKLTWDIRLLQTGFIWIRALNITLIPCLISAVVAYFAARRFYPAARPWLGALFFGGLCFAFIIPGKAPMAYEDRQMLPYVALSIALGLVGIARWVQVTLTRLGGRASYLHLTMVHALVLFMVIGNFYDYDRKYVKMFFDFPSAPHIESEKLALFDKVEQGNDKPLVYFQIGRVLSSKKYVRPGFSQINPVDEWYSKGTVLTVPDFHALTHDLAYFWGKAEGQFAPILIAKKTLDFPLPDNELFQVQKFPWRIAESWNEKDLWAYRLVPEPRSLAEANPVR